MTAVATSPFGALAVIVDPRAGEGRVAANVDAVRRALEREGLEHRLLIADGPGEVTRLASAVLDDGYRYVAAVGGDETIQGVVNGMFRDGRTIVESPVLAVLAAGADCDLIRSFGLPGDVDAASRHLAGDTTYGFDVMKISATGAGGTPLIDPKKRFLRKRADAETLKFASGVVSTDGGCDQSSEGGRGPPLMRLYRRVADGHRFPAGSVFG